MDERGTSLASRFSNCYRSGDQKPSFIYQSVIESGATTQGNGNYIYVTKDAADAAIRLLSKRQLQLGRG